MQKGLDKSSPISNIISMKTAISIPDKIFTEVEKVVKEDKFSRSKIITIALEEFLEKRKAKKLLDALNLVYSDAELPEELASREASKKNFIKNVIKEEY